MNGSRDAETLFTSLCARAQQQIPTSLYICGFYCKDQHFHFFSDFARFLRKKVSLIIRTYANLAENGYFARKK